MITLSLLEHLEKIPYLLSLFFPVALFFLAGLALAWVIWRKEGRRLEKVLAEYDQLSADFSSTSQKKYELARRFSRISHKRQESTMPDRAQKNQAGAELPPRSSEKSAQKAELIQSDFFEGESVEVDPKYGLLFTERPVEVDDLKKIKGVAGVLEGKLHEIGLYRFRQIALWTEEQAADFSERLAFPGRVERDQWVQQAAALHAEKYGGS